MSMLAVQPHAGRFLFRERRKAQTAQAGLRVSVEVDKADDAFVRIPLQPLSHLPPYPICRTEKQSV